MRTYGSEGWGFESLRARQRNPRSRSRLIVVCIVRPLIWPLGRIGLADLGRGLVGAIGVASPGYRWPCESSVVVMLACPSID